MQDELRRIREERKKAFFQQCKPNLINSFFKVHYYNGGSERDDLKIDNILNIDINSENHKQHCSGHGKNYDLVLEYTGQQSVFSLTHFQILGCPECTSPINDGVLVVLKDVHNTEEEIVEWGKQWNDARKEDVEKWNKKDELVDGSPVHFETNGVMKNFEITFQKLRTGKYLYLKFISGPDRNIDIRQIGIFGLIGDKSMYDKFSPSLQENIFNQHKVEIDRFRSYKMYEYFFLRPCLVVVSRSQSLRTLAKNLTKTDKDLVVYYLPTHISVDTSAPPGPVEFDFGLRFDNIEMKESVYMLQRDNRRRIEKRWKLEEPYTQSRIIQFIEGVRSKQIDEWIRESPPPPVVENTSEVILTLVRSTFGPSILQRKCGRPALISFTHPSLPNFGCENHLEDVKKEYGDSLIVGKYDLKSNDVPMAVTVGCYFYGDANTRGRPTHYNDASPNPDKEKFLQFVKNMMSNFSQIHTTKTTETTIDPQNTVKIKFVSATTEDGGEEVQQQSSSQNVRKGDRIQLQGFTLIFQHRIRGPQEENVENTPSFRVEMLAKKRANQEVMNVIRANKSSKLAHSEIMKIRHELSAEFIDLVIIEQEEKKTGRIVMCLKSMAEIEEVIYPEIVKVVNGMNNKDEEEGKSSGLEEIVMLDNEKKCRCAYIKPYFVAFVPVISASQNLILQFRVDENLHLVNQFKEFVKNMFLD